VAATEGLDHARFAAANQGMGVPPNLDETARRAGGLLRIAICSAPAPGTSPIIFELTRVTLLLVIAVTCRGFRWGNQPPKRGSTCRSYSCLSGSVSPSLLAARKASIAASWVKTCTSHNDCAKSLACYNGICSVPEPAAETDDGEPSLPPRPVRCSARRANPAPSGGLRNRPSVHSTRPA